MTAHASHLASSGCGGMPLTEPAGPYRLFKVNTFTRRVFVAGQNNQCAGHDYGFR